MKWLSQKIVLTVFALGFLSLFSQALYSQTAWVKRVIERDTFLLTNGERVRLVGVDSQRAFPV